MNRKRWLAPVLLALPFVVVVIVEIAEVTTRRTVGEVDLVRQQGDAIRFHPLESVYDMRQPPAETTRGGLKDIEPTEGWGETTRQGRWTASHRAAFRLDLDLVGRRIVWIECRADRRKGPPPKLAISINDAPIGVRDVTEKMATYRFEVDPAGAVKGRNSAGLELLDSGSGAPAVGRTLLVRRLALTGEQAVGFPSAKPASPTVVDLEAGTVRIRQAGRFVLPFRLSAGGSALEFRYRFRNPEPDARAQVIVGRRHTERGHYRLVQETSLVASTKRSGRFRQILHDRFEPNVLIIDVDEQAAAGGFVIKDLMLTTDR
jgi:hypothetical protein